MPLRFDVPVDRILPVDMFDVVLDPRPHPLETGHAAAIVANWQCERAARPALFDGTVVLLSELAYSAAKLSGRCHGVRYSTFLYWRRNRSMAGAGHVFAHAMLVASDGALVAIRMAGHTVNAGRVYFAAGSFEPGDFPNGRADLHRNMAREVHEETGIDISEARRDARHHALSTATGTVVFRRYHLAETADAASLRIARFAALEAGAEISGPVVIRSAGDLPDGLMPHMRPLIEWHFADIGG